MPNLTDRGSADRRKTPDRRAGAREFVAIVSHELRTPIAAIRGFAETLREGDVDPKTRQMFIRIIEKHAQRLGQLVENILELSALEAGQREPQLEEIELSSFIEGFLKTIDPLLKRKKLKVIRALEGSVLADSAQFHRILQNIFSNAIKHSPASSSIEVAAARGQGRVLLEIKDQGQGIAPEHLPHIFEKFNHFHRGGSLEGTGLGLSIVKQLIEGQRGTIEVKSRLGAGTSVVLSLRAV